MPRTNSTRTPPRTIRLNSTLATVTLAFVLAASSVGAETCTTQSALSAADRTNLADAARALAAKVQANEADSLRASATDELAKNFGALQYLVAVLGY